MNEQTLSDSRNVGKKGPGRPALPDDQKSKKESVYARPKMKRILEELYPGLPFSQQVNQFVIEFSPQKLKEGSGKNELEI